MTITPEESARRSRMADSLARLRSQSAPEPVDVLAVMDECAGKLRHALVTGLGHAIELEEARAAIAELIRETTLMLEASPATASEREYYEARVRAALARVGGAL